MRIVIFGLSITSSWGNGHATQWRSLCRGLHDKGHHVTFFERDLPFYASHRDVERPDYCELVLYRHWVDALAAASRALGAADLGIVTSYCPDATLATDLLISSRVPIRAFYDLDTPVTLERLDHAAMALEGRERGEGNEYLGARALADFDIVLSFSGGRALDALRNVGARRVAPLYGSVDPEVHAPAAPDKTYRGDFSYLGTFGADRQDALQDYFLEPARRLPDRRFVLGGSLYPTDFPWQPNVWYVHHVPPSTHSQFYCSSPLTLNVTRGAMRRLGFCPPGRLFEAAACGVAMLTDAWEGLDAFFEPGREILVADTPDAVVEALRLPPVELARIGAAARARALGEHSGARRAQELVAVASESVSESRIRPAVARDSGRLLLKG
jgi:spore maturation protein CgeB